MLSRWHRNVHAAIEAMQLLPHRSRVLLAVSGGQDSSCLLRILVDLSRRKKYSWDLGVAHCNHRWDGDDDIVTQVKKEVSCFQLPFYLHEACESVRSSTSEARARDWRYQMLLQTARAEHYDHVVTGHTLTDRAETILFNLFRGSGSQGLASLQWKRNLDDRISLARPMLNLRRMDTARFCNEFEIPYWKDVYNEDMTKSRNRIRKEILPLIRRYLNPQVDLALIRIGDILSDESRYLDSIAQEALATSLTLNSSPSSSSDPRNQPTLDGTKLNQMDVAVQRRVLRRFLSQVCGTDAISFRLVEKIRALQHSKTPVRISLPGKTRPILYSSRGVFEIRHNP